MLANTSVCTFQHDTCSRCVLPGLPSFVYLLRDQVRLDPSPTILYLAAWLWCCCSYCYLYGGSCLWYQRIMKYQPQWNMLGENIARTYSSAAYNPAAALVSQSVSQSGEHTVRLRLAAGAVVLDSREVGGCPCCAWPPLSRTVG